MVTEHGAPTVTVDLAFSEGLRPESERGGHRIGLASAVLGR